MISPTGGSIWIPIISTMNSLSPLKRYLASATAARKASTIAIATVTSTMMMLFLTSSQKYGWRIAFRKWSSVGCSGIHCGFSAMIPESGLNAVDTIQ